MHNVLVALSVLLTTIQPVIADDIAPYAVMDGHQVDARTFNGYRLYRNWCARCHGTFAEGLAGPNLAESLNRISREEFDAVVAKGKMGQIGMMPAWESNTQVMEGRDDMYRYLKARADGVLGEVRPTKAP